MKHLFRIHSPITYRVGRRVMAHLGLDPADVRLLTARSFDPGEGDLVLHHNPFGPLLAD